MWTFQGQLLAHVEKGQFYQFSWRPRPPPLLTPEQQRKVKKGTCLFLSYVYACIRVYMYLSWCPRLPPSHHPHSPNSLTQPPTPQLTHSTNPKTDLRKYERRFDKADREKEMAKQREEWAAKGARRREFRGFYAERLAEFNARRAELVALQKGYDDEDPNNYEVRVVTRRMVPLGEPELVSQ